MPAPPHARRLIPGLLAFALLLTTPPLVSAWPTDPSVNLPVTTGGGASGPVQTAPDGSGGVYVTWCAGSDVFARHILSTGIADPVWPAGGLAVCTATGVQQLPRIISDGAGGAILCWMDQRSGNWDIYAQRVLATGVIAWTANGRAVCTATGDQNYPQLIADGAGGTVMTWFDERAGAANADIYAQDLTSTGTLPVHGWPVNGRAICTATGIQSYPCIVSDQNGGAIIAWTDQRSGGNFGTTYAQHLQLTGLVDTAWPVNGRLICSQFGFSPLAVTDKSGGAVIAWVDQRGSDLDIYAMRVLAGGTLDSGWPVDGVAVCSAIFVQNHLAIATDGAGGAYLAWADRRANGVEDDVYAQHLLVNGTRASGWPANGSPVCTDPGSQNYSSIAFTNDGAIVAWSGDGGVKAQHLLSVGGADTRWPAGGRVMSLDSYPFLFPSACADIWNGAVVAWANSTPDVYAQRVSNDGALGNDFSLLTTLTGVQRAACLWADVNGDGALDLLVSGRNGIDLRTDVYSWDGSAFQTQFSNLPGVEWASFAAADFDGDGQVDLALCGDLFGPVSGIYRNTGNGVFVSINAPLPQVSRGAVAWADFDNDGDLDLLISGEDNDGVPITKVFANSYGSFIDASQSLGGLAHCSAAWADFDNDGDQDLVICGRNGDLAQTVLFRNDNGTLSDSGISLHGVSDGAVEWADVNHDGFLDLVVTGWDGSARRSDVYNGNGFSLVEGTGWSPGLSPSALAVGDMDNDGDLDFVESGNDSLAGLTRIGRFDNGGAFLDPGVPLTGVYESANAWGDFNGDGNLDLVVTGTTGATDRASVYTSYATTPNARPSPPGTPTSVRNGNTVTFSWAAASDDHTPAAALTYNLKIGTTPGGNDVMASMAANDGRRRVAQPGNCGMRTTWTITLPPGSGYYYSVQAIDGAYLGSAFAAGVTTTGVEEGAISSAAGLRPASPNPFRASTEVAFTLSRAGAVDLTVFDPAGRRVRQLVHGAQPAGVGRVSWDGRDGAGAVVANGLYFVRLESEGRAWTGKVVVAR